MKYKSIIYGILLYIAVFLVCVVLTISGALSCSIEELIMAMILFPILIIAFALITFACLTVIKEFLDENFGGER